MPENDDERGKAQASVQAREEFVAVEFPAALRVIFARAATDPALARKLVFDYFAYAGPDANKQSPHGDILNVLAFSFKAINTNSRDAPEAARRILDQLKRIA
jgi:hypothetical protein